MIDGMPVFRPKIGQREQNQDEGRGGAVDVWLRQRRSPQAAKRAERCSPECTQRSGSASTFGPSLPSTAGSSVIVAARTKATLIMIPSAIERNAGLGTSITAESETKTVKPENSTAFPAVSIVTGDRVADRQLGAEVGAAEAMDDEERVVDPEREREHQREVHRPDRDLEAVREQREQPGGGEQAEDRQHQRQPGRDQ